MQIFPFVAKNLSCKNFGNHQFAKINSQQNFSKLRLANVNLGEIFRIVHTGKSKEMARF